MNRREFLIRAAGILAAPAIVRVASIMPISAPVSFWKMYSGYDVIETSWDVIYNIVPTETPFTFDSVSRETPPRLSRLTPRVTRWTA